MLLVIKTRELGLLYNVHIRAIKWSKGLLFPVIKTRQQQCCTVFTCAICVFWSQLKEMQSRLDEAESAASRGGKKMIQKLETRVHELESMLESEQRRSQEADKNMRKHEKRVSELMAQLDEGRRSHDQYRDAVDQLETKIKTFKRQAEEAVSQTRTCLLLMLSFLSISIDLIIVNLAIFNHYRVLQMTECG